MHKKQAATKLKLNTLPNEPLQEHQSQNFQFKSISQEPNFIQQKTNTNNINRNDIISPTFAKSDTISIGSMGTVRNGKENFNNNEKQFTKKDHSKGHNPRISQLSEISNHSNIPEKALNKNQRKHRNTAIQKHLTQFDQGKYQIQVGQNHRLVQTIEALTLKNQKLSQLYKACKKQLQKKLPQVFLKLKNSSPTDEDNIDLYLQMMAAVGKSKNLKKQKDEIQHKKNQVTKKLEQFETINNHLIKQIDSKNKELIKYFSLEQQKNWQKRKENEIKKQRQMESKQIQALKQLNSKYESKITQLQQQVTKGNKKIKEMQCQIAQIKKKQLLAEQIEKSRNNLAKSKKQLEQKFKKASEKLAQQSKQIQSYQQKVRILQLANQRLKSQLDMSMKEHKQKSQFEQKKDQQMEQLKQQIKELQQKSFTDQMANNDLRKQNTQLIKKIDIFQEQLDSKNRQINELKLANGSLEQGQSMIGMIKQEVAKIRQNESRLMRQNDTLKRQKQTLIQKLDNSCNQNAKLLENAEEFKQTINQQQKDLQQLRKTIMLNQVQLKNQFHELSQEQIPQDTSEFRIRRAIKYDDYSKKKKTVKDNEKYQKTHGQKIQKSMNQNYEAFTKKQRLATNLFEIKSILNFTINRNAQYSSLPQSTDRSNSLFSKTKTESINNFISKTKLQHIGEQSFQIQTQQILNMARLITNEFFVLKQELLKFQNKSNFESKESYEDECEDESQASDEQEQQLHQIIENKQRALKNLALQINLKQKIISKLTNFIPQNLKQMFVDYIFAIEKLVQSKRSIEEGIYDNTNFQMNNSNQYVRNSNFYQANSMMMNFEKNFNELGSKFDKEIQIWKLNKEVKQQKLENQLRELKKLMSYNHSQSLSQGNFISTPHQKRNQYYTKKSTQYRTRQDEPQQCKNHRVKTQQQNYLSFGGPSTLQENSCQFKNQPLVIAVKPKKKKLKNSDHRKKDVQQLSKNQIRDKYYLR